MTLTEENVAETAFDLEQMVFYYEHHGKFPVDDDILIKTLRDAADELRALRFYAD